MENTNMDRELVKIENLQEHIYQLLLPHAHSIERIKVALISLNLFFY